MITILALSDLGRTSKVTCTSTLIHSHMVITISVNINYSFYAHVYNCDYAHILYLHTNSSSYLVRTVTCVCWWLNLKRNSLPAQRDPAFISAEFAYWQEEAVAATAFTRHINVIVHVTERPQRLLRHF